MRNWWTVELLNSIVYYPVFIAAYFLFYQLTKWKPVNALLSRTSPSFFLGQYREPETSLEDLTQREPRLP